MRIVLRADVVNVGKKGDVVDVADGFARNYLLPRGVAMTANGKAEAQAASMRRSRNVKDAAERGAAEEIATRLVPATIRVSARAGTEGRLFGSITTSDIVDAVRSQTGIQLDRRKLHLDEPIKSTGTFIVPAKLHADVEFPVTVEVSGS
jgi:large subunit ribosomal protein L9